MCIFLETCVYKKGVNFYYLSIHRQIKVIKRCQLKALMPLFYIRIKEQLLVFDCCLISDDEIMERLKSSLRKFYGQYGDLIKHYEVSLSQMSHDVQGHDHVQ